MVVMKRIFSLLTISSLLFAGSCDLFSSDPELPPATMEGRNTFGCLVDGKLFLPKAPIGYGTGISAAIQTSIDTIGINIQAGNVETDQSFFLSIYDSPSLEAGKTYDLSNPDFFIQYIDYSKQFSCTSDEVISGNIQISKFEILGSNKIIAGTFNFTIHSADCNTTVVVTKGRFDIGDVD